MAGGPLLLSSLLLAMAMPAHAAGGAHVVDDSEVESPGTCHVDGYVSRSSGDQWLVYTAPACTRWAMSHLEIGGFVSHAITCDRTDTLVGFTPKWTLRMQNKGLGIALSGSLNYGIDQRRLESASLIMPITLPVGADLRLHANAGWIWTRAGNTHDMFFGGQAEYLITPHLEVMAEGFSRDEGKIGGQTGLRLTTDAGHLDIDLLYGRYVDGITPGTSTFGMTLRF